MIHILNFVLNSTKDDNAINFILPLHTLTYSKIFANRKILVFQDEHRIKCDLPTAFPVCGLSWYIHQMQTNSTLFEIHLIILRQYSIL